MRNSGLGDIPANYYMHWEIITLVFLVYIYTFLKYYNRN